MMKCCNAAAKGGQQQRLIGAFKYLPTRKLMGQFWSGSLSHLKMLCGQQINVFRLASTNDAKIKYIDNMCRSCGFALTPPRLTANTSSLDGPKDVDFAVLLIIVVA